MVLPMRQFVISPDFVEDCIRRRRRRNSWIITVSVLSAAIFLWLRNERPHFDRPRYPFPEDHDPPRNQTTFSFHLDSHSLYQKRRSLGWLNSTTTQNHSDKVTLQIPIVIQLSGEFGNHLSKIAAGVGVAALLHSYNTNSPYHFTTTIQVRKQAHTTKGETAMVIFRQCFPLLVELTDPENNEDHVPSSDLYPGINSNRDTSVDATIFQILRDAVQALDASRPHQDDVDNNDPMTTFHAPFTLYSNHLVGFFDVYMDRLYDLYRELFYMRNDTADCACIDIPFADEIVYYHRGYSAELPKKGLRLGFEEISPATLVSYLTETLQYTPHNSRVAIVSRFPGAPTQPYVDALTHAGFAVRVMGRSNTLNATNNNSVASILHDFCFLRHAQQELIGPVRSTFFQWAAVLRASTTHVRVTAYAMESQLLWAESTSSSDSTSAAYDSVTPMYYYGDPTVNSTLWQERNFFFPLLPSQKVADPPLQENTQPP